MKYYIFADERFCEFLFINFRFISVENKLLDQDWGSKPGSCEACKNDKEFGCATQVCVVSTLTKIPKQYDNICEFYKYLNHRTYAKKSAYCVF